MASRPEHSPKHSEDRTQAEKQSAAERKPTGGEDRPGFDLGGSSEENRKLGPKDIIPGGPRKGPAPGGTADKSSGGSSSGGGATDGTSGVDR